MPGGSLRQAGPERASFDHRHTEWLARVLPGPLYCLPEKAIDRLVHPYVGRPAVLDKRAERAERELFALCDRHHAVGFNGGRAIEYPYLPPHGVFPRQLYPEFGWTKAQCLAARRRSDRQIDVVAAMKPLLNANPATIGRRLGQTKSMS